MGSTTFQGRFGEDTYPLGRYILDRTRTLGISRTELVRRLGYRQIGNGHRALAEMLTTGMVPPQIAEHLADALQVDEAIVAAVTAATVRQQRDEAADLACARAEAPSHARVQVVERQAVCREGSGCRRPLLY